MEERLATALERLERAISESQQLNAQTLMAQERVGAQIQQVVTQLSKRFAEVAVTLTELGERLTQSCSTVAASVSQITSTPRDAATQSEGYAHGVTTIAPTLRDVWVTYAMEATDSYISHSNLDQAVHHVREISRDLWGEEVEVHPKLYKGPDLSEPELILEIRYRELEPRAHSDVLAKREILRERFLAEVAAHDRQRIALTWIADHVYST